MSRNLRANRRRRNSSSNPRNTQNVQKANGVISPRVKQVGGEKFAIVCVDPAKHRSEWMMADYFGNLLIEPQTLEHQAAFFKLAVVQIREAQQQHDIQDTIVVVAMCSGHQRAAIAGMFAQITASAAIIPRPGRPTRTQIRQGT